VTVEAALVELAEHVRTQATSPELAWGVLLDGRLALTGGTAATSTVFRIASMTKSFTAATVLARRDRGELRLDDEIGLLGGVRATKDSPPVTIRDVLSMSAGLATDDPWADRHLDIDPEELTRLVRAGVRFARPTGTGYEYSNLGYALLGDMSAPTDELLLRPLGLDRTTWTQPEHDDWARPPGEVPLGHGALAGMGGLWSNIEDLARWIAFLDDAFPARDDPDHGPLRRSSRREMQQVHRARPLARSDAHGEGIDHAPARIDAGGYGYGLQVLHDDRFGVIVGHGGGLPGYGSHMRWLPGRRVGVVALANATYAPMGRLTPSRPPCGGRPTTSSPCCSGGTTTPPTGSSLTTSPSTSPTRSRRLGRRRWSASTASYISRRSSRRRRPTARPRSAATPARSR
jgi:CubicO group peptidase (beta-lactamase class C family)